MDTKMQVSSLDETLTGELDIKKAFRSVWLVKVPAFIFDLWKNSPSNAPLGTVTVAEYSNSDPQMSVTAATGESSIPKEYSLSPPAAITTTNGPPIGQTYILSEEGEGENMKLAIEGNVQHSHKFDMKPKYSQEYKGVLRNRMRQSEKKLRQTVTIDEKDVVTNSRPYSRILKNDLGNKKERKDRVTLLQEIFKLFERQAHYQTKELELSTRQPAIYLKTVLDEVCLLNKRGPFKGKWELKPQYKNKNLEQQQIQAAKELQVHNLQTQNEWLGIQNRQ